MGGIRGGFERRLDLWWVKRGRSVKPCLGVYLRQNNSLFSKNNS